MHLQLDCYIAQHTEESTSTRFVDLTFVGVPWCVSPQTLLEQLKLKYDGGTVIPFDKIPPTVGQNIGNLKMGQVDLLVWDLGGQPGLRQIWDKYSGEAHAIIYVVDAADAQRFPESAVVFENFLKREDAKDAPVLVLANKCDLDDAANAAVVGEAMRMVSVCDVRTGHLHTISGRTGEGVEEAMAWLGKALKQSAREVDAV